MTGDVQLRAAAVADAPAIASLHVRAWDSAYRGLMPDEVIDAHTFELRTRTWQQLLAGESDRATFVAEDRSLGVVGFCSCESSRDDDAGERVAEIVALYIDLERWRDGIGRSLLARAVSHLRASERFDEATLWVLVGNEPAIAFYERCGFTKDGSEVAHDQPAGGTHGLRALRMRAPLA